MATRTPGAFLAGLKAKGHAVEVPERVRVRQVGPTNTGAKGSCTIYRMTP